jgi:hypothetical protein
MPLSESWYTFLTHLTLKADLIKSLSAFPGSKKSLSLYPNIFIAENGKLQTSIDKALQLLAIQQ